MKFKRFFATILCASAVVLTSCSKYKDLSSIKKADKIVVSTNAEFAPFEYKVGEEFTGIDMDLIKEYAKYIDVKCEIVDMEFDGALTSVSTGKSDVAVAAITKNATREKTMSFTDSYYVANQVIIVKSDSAYVDLTSIEEVEGLLTSNKATIGCQRGTTGEYYIEGSEDWDFTGIASTICKSYDNAGLACQELSNGKIDAVIVDQAPAKLLVESNSNLKMLNFVLTEEEYAFAVAKGNTSLLESLNEFIAYAKENGLFDTIVSKYYEA